MWQEPLMVSARIDKRFDALPEMAYREHMMPRDLLPSAKSVVVFFIPFRKELIRENKKGDRPCRNWGSAYVRTNDLIDRAGTALSELLAEHNFKSGLTPATHNFDETALMARLRTATCHLQGNYRCHTNQRYPPLQVHNRNRPRLR